MKIKLSDHPTYIYDIDKKDTQELTRKILAEIGELQYKMYAQNKYSILVVLQGIDASGKDGLTNGLLSNSHHVGSSTYSFRRPTDEEMAHDFLWRVHRQVPAKGGMTVFIRSHYEDILVPSVEKYIPAKVIDKRYQMINNFEALLEQNNTRVLKFFLHVSKKSQKERLLERIEQPEKYWKHKDGDWDTRKKFDEYMEVYEKIINKCNDVPWNIIPADKNWQKLYFVADVVLRTLREMDLEWPELVSERFGKNKPEETENI